MDVAAIALTQLVATGLVWIIADRAGANSFSMGYTTLANTRLSDDMGFNVYFRVLTPVVLLCLLALLLHSVGLGWLTVNLWLVAVWYWAVRFLYLLVRDWYAFTPPTLLWIPAAGSVALTWYFYTNAMAKGVEGLIPDGRDAAFQLWLVVLGFVYLWLRQGRDAERDDVRANTELRRRVQSFKARFHDQLDEHFRSDPVRCGLLYAFMFVEDYNRPRVLRWFERIMWRSRRIKTTGIMQVRSDRPLSDPESVEQAAVIITDLLSSAIARSWDEYWTEMSELYDAEGAVEEPLIGAGRAQYSLWRMNVFVTDELDQIYAGYRGLPLSDYDDALRQAYEVALEMCEPRVSELDGNTDIVVSLGG